MAYEKQNWIEGEVITKEKLNHIEEGISNIELTPGPQGEKGNNGKEIELTKTSTHIKWRYAGQAEGIGWTNLVELSELKGNTGATGPQGPAGQDAVINKLNKVDSLDSGAEVATVVAAFNNLIADLKAKGFMNES